MKKFFASAIFIAAFAVYAVYQNSINAENASSAIPTTTNAPTQTVADSTGSDTQSAPLPTPNPTPTPQSTPIPKPKGEYTDGTYVGTTVDAFYGYIQVEAIISGGKLIDVQFLQYPNDRSTSIMISRQAMPSLKSEAIAAQSANVDGVSGATDTSIAFRESLGAALTKAKA